MRAESEPRKRRWSAWRQGCGLGCALALVAIIVVAGFGAFHVSRTLRSMEQSVVAAKERDERFGSPSSFTPQPDGAIASERMAAFLAVRDALDEARRSLVATFETLPVKRDEEIDALPLSEQLELAFDFGKSALRLGPRIGEFYSTRDRAMLKAQIGMGEYAYIYTVAYYSWLGHPPSDGPRTDPRTDAEGREDEFRMRGSALARLRADLIQNLRNQLASLPAESALEWRHAIEGEIEAMERDSERFPWQGAVPQAIFASLEPHRLRLEASYHPVTNAFELSRTEKTRRWSYTVE